MFIIIFILLHVTSGSAKYFAEQFAEGNAENICASQYYCCIYCSLSTVSFPLMN